MERFLKKIFSILFVLYIASVILILFFYRESNKQISIAEYFFRYGNFEPMKTLVRYIRYIYIKKDMGSILLALANIGGNLILFLPMGFFLPCLFRELRRPSNAFCIIAFIIFSSEIFQGIFRLGIPDVDDFLLNFLGALIGFAIAELLGFCEKIPS